MKRINFLFLILFFLISLHSFGQSVSGGAGIIHGTGDPNGINSLDVQDSRYESLFFVDTSTWKTYKYNGANVWNEIDYHSKVTLDAGSSPTLTLNGQELKLDFDLISSSELQQLAVDIMGNATATTTFSQGLSVDDLITLTGVASGSVNLGTFTGATIVDNRTIKQAFQDIETALENIPTKKQDVVANYASLPSSNQQAGDIAYVVDATGDPTVESGAAMYIWNGSAWVKVAELGAIDIVTDLSVTNITGTTLDIASSTGTDATVPAATNTTAGLLTATRFVEIDTLVSRSHFPVSVTDGASIDFTLTGQNITGIVKPNSIGATELSSTGVGANTYGSSSSVPQITVDADGRITSATNVSIVTGDGSVTNEGVLGVAAGTPTSSVITSNTSGATGVTVSVSTGLSISETTNTNGGTITLTNTAPDQTVSLTGAGITSVSGTYPNFTITSTEVDGSISNEGQLSVGTGASNTSQIQSNTSGSNAITIDGGTDKGISVTESGSTISINLGSLEVYDNDVAARNDGLAIGDWYEVSASNTMGLVPGTVRKVKY
jgi:hypothetical protein